MGGERFEMTSCRRPTHPNHWHAVKLMTEEPNPITDIGDDASTLAREVQISLPTRCMEVTQSQIKRLRSGRNAPPVYIRVSVLQAYSEKV